jgi:hypothetical protein
LVAPVGFLGLDEVAAEDLAGGEVSDGDVVVVGEREDAFAGVLAPTPRWCIRPARRRLILPFVIEPVVAQPVVAWWCPLLAGSALSVAR